MGQQRYSDAETVLREALRAEEKRPDSWELFVTRASLGASLAAQVKLADAEPELAASCNQLLQRQAQIPWEGRRSLKQSCENLIGLYETWGKTQTAGEWRGKIARNSTLHSK
jgi:hypothetical protein